MKRQRYMSKQDILQVIKGAITTTVYYSLVWVTGWDITITITIVTTFIITVMDAALIMTPITGYTIAELGFMDLMGVLAEQPPTTQELEHTAEVPTDMVPKEARMQGALITPTMIAI